MQAVLFDADGVVQSTSALDYPPGSDLTREFWLELFSLERPLLRGDGDFPTLLRELMQRHGVEAPVAQLLGIWQDLTVDQDVVALIEEVRLPCYLATNQQHFRTAHMRRTLGYDEVFDDQFYSCEIGHAKPEPQYFQAVLAMVGRPAGEVLFIDDSAANVAAARECGLVAELHDPASGAAGVRAILVRHGVLPA